MVDELKGFDFDAVLLLRRPTCPPRKGHNKHEN